MRTHDGRGVLRGRVTRLGAALALGCAIVLTGAGAASAAIFWVNTDNNAIGVANLGKTHGLRVNQQLIRGLGLAEGITTGPNNYIYWSDSSNDRISRAHLYYDKHGRLHVRVTRNFITGADQPEGVAVYGGYIYWVNHDTAGSIGRAQLNGTSVNENFVPQEQGGADLNYATGIAVTSTYIYWADTDQESIARASTATGAGATQFINLAAGGGYHVPTGVAVSGPYIYWSDGVDNGTIGRANLDGSGVNDSFITGALGPCMLAVAGNHIYWTNSGGGTTAESLGRANLDGTGATEHYVNGASSPCGIAVNAFVLKPPRKHHRG